MGSMKPSEWAMLLLLSLFWGGSFFFVKVALRELQPFTIVWLRVSLAAVILFTVARARGLRLPASFGTWAPFFLLAALNTALPFSLIVWGQKYIASGVASILNATTPIFTVLLAHVLTTDERLRPAKAAGVMIGFAGAFCMLAPELMQHFDWHGLGQLAVLGAAVSYSLAGIYGKRFKASPPIVTAALMLTCAGIMMTPLALGLDAPWRLRPSPATVGAVLGIATVSTAAAYLLYFRILAAAGATNVMLVTLLIPVSALLLGVGVLGETIQTSDYLGMGLIFAGLALIDGRVIVWLKRKKLYLQHTENKS
jgi:drug/metabolite transporter (DMT)-like permease